MSRVLAVPNWSFGRDRHLLRLFGECLDGAGVFVHFLQSDVDHNRTVSAFSGPAEAVFQALNKLADLAFDRIDMSRHVGVHPRIGALDVCPFVPLDGLRFDELKPEVEAFGAGLAARFELPIYLYERSERGRHESDLPSLRKGGFGGLLDRELRPDFGPTRAHRLLGATVMGARDFLIAMNVDLATTELSIAKDLARRIRALRADGDSRFLGVRALGLPLASRGLTQVSLNLTLPDAAPPDPVIEWVTHEAVELGAGVKETELIGVIRREDLPVASRLPVEPAQVVDGAHKIA